MEPSFLSSELQRAEGTQGVPTLPSQESQSWPHCALNATAITQKSSQWKKLLTVSQNSGSIDNLFILHYLAKCFFPPTVIKLLLQAVTLLPVLSAMWGCPDHPTSFIHSEVFTEHFPCGSQYTIVPRTWDRTVTKIKFHPVGEIDINSNKCLLSD